MRLIDIPFTQLSPNDTPRPWLEVTIINPHSNKRIKTLALIDTGADECALPAMKSFLSNFILTIDYPRHVFSLTFPNKK